MENRWGFNLKLYCKCRKYRASKGNPRDNFGISWISCFAFGWGTPEDSNWHVHFALKYPFSLGKKGWGFASTMHYFLSMLRALCAFDTIECIWWDHVPSFEKMTPRCLWLSTSSISSPFSCKDGWFTSFISLENIMHLVLGALHQC